MGGGAVEDEDGVGAVNVDVVVVGVDGGVETGADGVGGVEGEVEASEDVSDGGGVGFDGGFAVAVVDGFSF